MNNSDFISAFNDFMKHSEIQKLYFDRLKVHQKYSQNIIMNEIEKKAAELEITCDYYIMEFL